MTKKTNKDLNREAQLNDEYYRSLLGQTSQHKSLAISAASVNSLAYNYENTQRILNNAIKDYNVYRRKIHVLFIAVILGYEKENYIDEDKLELINIQGFNEDEI